MSIKSILVTGASRGIGHAIAEKLARKGHSLYMICRKNTDMMADIPGKYFTGNVADYDFVREVFSQIPSLDVLINNAGISWTGLLQDMTKEEWDEVISVNLSSVYNTCHFASGLMVKQHSGKIINISSVWGERGASMEVAYSASKGGVNAFTKALAKELAPSSIQVNAVSCGFIDTDMNSIYSPEDRSAIMEEIPTGRSGDPAEVADLVSKLIEAPDYLTGQIIGLDGGWQV